jgi:single-stranded DNA-binding protein
LGTGPLVGDPQRRAGAKGSFTTATIRTSGDEAVLVSIIAFGADGERLLEFSKGDALAVSGRARLTKWTGRDGVEKHGLSLVAEQIAAAKPSSRPAAGASASGAPDRARARSLYAPSMPSRGAELPADRVDDLWPVGGAP